MRPVEARDAAITGTGLVTALGFGVEAVCEALGAGRTGIREIGDAASGTARNAGAPVEAPFLRTVVPREMEAQIKFLNGAGQLAVEATAEAVADADLLAAGIDPSMRGLYLSQTDSGDWDCHEFLQAARVASEGFSRPLSSEAMNRASARHLKPFFLLESLKNNAFSFLARQFELRGANTSLAGFCGPTHEALAMGARSVTRGALEAAVVVGAAHLATGAARVEMEDLGLSRLPDRAIPGDGAGALVVERLESALGRGRPPLAAILGQASRNGPAADGLWAPSVDTLLDAAAQALREAGAGADDILGVVVPGVGESGLEAALDDLAAAAGAPRVCWKPATGHLGLASTAVEAAVAARAVATGHLPGAGEPGGAGRAVLLLSAGLFGQAGALVLAPVRRAPAPRT